MRLRLKVGEGYPPMTVRALRVNEWFAVDRRAQEKWVVTHIPSGYKFAAAKTKARAVKAAQRAATLGTAWNFKHPTVAMLKRRFDMFALDTMLSECGASRHR